MAFLAAIPEIAAAVGEGGAAAGAAGGAEAAAGGAAEGAGGIESMKMPGMSRLFNDRRPGKGGGGGGTGDAAGPLNNVKAAQGA